MKKLLLLFFKRLIWVYPQKNVKIDTKKNMKRTYKYHVHIVNINMATATDREKKRVLTTVNIFDFGSDFKKKREWE